jgi:hypothetical protein
VSYELTREYDSSGIWLCRDVFQVTRNISTLIPENSESRTEIGRVKLSDSVKSQIAEMAIRIIAR